MDDKELALNLANKEMDESVADLDRQHKQIRWYIQLYVGFVAAFFALAGFMGTKDHILGANPVAMPPTYVIVVFRFS